MPTAEAGPGGAWGLERFTFSGVLGEGGSGTVYLAHDAVTGTDVAVKLLDAQLSDSPGYLERFFAEVQTLKALSHDNVVRIVDHGRNGTQAWLATEYVPGGSLRQLLEHDGRLSAAQALGVLSGALAGLVYVHEAGVLHGDITPGNILVDPAGTSKLTDFGSAIGPSGRGFGVTAAYASPEAAQGLPLDERSDVYSMGVVLYECLAGHLPFSGASEEVVLHRHLTVEPPPIEGLARPLHQLVEETLAKDPEQRPQSAADLLARLEAAAELSEGPSWRERASVAALAAVAGGELGALLAPALLGSDAATPHAVAQQTVEAAARHGSAVAGSGGGGATGPTVPATPSSGPPPSLPRRIAQAVSAHKVAAVTTAAVLTAAGVGAGVLAATSQGGSQASTSSTATSSPASGQSSQTGQSSQSSQSDQQGQTGAGTGSGSNGAPANAVADPAGGSWSPPTPVPDAAMSAVSCATANFCVGVGQGTYLTYDGTKWTAPAAIGSSAQSSSADLADSPAPGPDPLSCPVPGFCVMVGGEQGQAFVYDKGAWTATQVDSNSANLLNSVSCASPTFCMALDDSGDAYVFDGAAWGPPLAIDVADMPANLGGALSCPSAGFCMAVVDSGKAIIYVNGSWSPPVVVSSRGVGPSLYLGAVSCTSASFCVAMGGYSGSNTSAFTYDGSTWSGPTSMDQAPTTGPGLVSCATPTFCKAIDQEVGIVTYSGSSWLGPATLGLDYADGDGLSSLSCPAADFCMGVAGKNAQRFYGPS